MNFANFTIACSIVVISVDSLPGAERRVTEAKELEEACQIAVPGDEIILAKGIYQISEKSRILIAGRPGPITVRGVSGHPEDVVVEGLGQDNESVQVVFELTDSPKWTFRDLTTRNSFYHGFKLNGSSTDCVLRNVVMRDHGESGVKGTSNPSAKTYPDRLLVEGCDIGFTRQSGGTRSVVEGIDGVAVAGWTIRGNRFLNVQKSGGAAYGAFTKGNSIDTVIENNRFENCFIGASFGGGGTGPAYFRDGDQTLEHRGGSIRNNVFQATSDAAIYLNKANGGTVEGNKMVACAMNIQLRYPETKAYINEGNATDNSEQPLVLLRDGASVLKDVPEK